MPMLITFEKLQNLYPDLADIYREADQIIRYDRSCSTCHAKEDAVKLKACSGCICSPNPTLYCSRTCQRAHWISHKVECLDTRDKYQDRNPKSWELRQEKRAFKMFAIALRANFSVFHWAARQAFMANPQHDTRTTVLEITYTRYVENQIIIAPFFPVKYRFSPMTQEQLQSIDPEEKGDGLGYFILSPPTGAGISGIKYITRDLDMMDIKTPQWPYVFASATAENETYVDRATTKLVAFVRIAQALGKPGVVGAPLEQITCGRFDGVWEMDHQKYLHWEKVLRTVL